MENFKTLERQWHGDAQGNAIRVEEHRNDLTYIVEFYDSNNDTYCISNLPNSQEALTVQLLQGEVAH